MIISNNAFVNITNTNKNFYKLKGYNVNDASLLVKIEDLPLSSHCKITVECFNCHEQKEIVYKNYNKQILSGDYYCNKCKSIKIKKTTKERYGEDSIFKLKEYQEKIENTMITKYGVKNALSSDEIKNKMIDKLKIKYNVDNISKIKEIKEKKINTLSKTWLERISNKNVELNIIDGDYQKQTLIMHCDLNKGHTFEISYDLFHNRKEFNSVFCTKCNSVSRNTFNVEKKFFKFIQDNYNGEILMNNRKIITPYELDLYLPELNLAFEFNGFKYHNDKIHDKNYHLMKYNLCKEKNISLIQFFQDDWIYKYEIVKSMILNNINKTPNKIDARKCKIEKINYNDTKEFMIKNHIQGYTSSKYNYGLLYNDKIVCILTMGERKINGNKIFELIRYSSLINNNIIGGFSKLFKYMTDELNIQKIITYANKLYSNGNIYEKNNFKYIGETKPNYSYIISNIRKHRYSYRKDKLIKNGYDKDKTEIEIMDERNILRIYDCGNKKYIWENKKGE